MEGTPAFSTAATMASDSPAFRPSGFSHITIFPASAAATAMSWCMSFGAATSMRSTSPRATSRRQSVSTSAKPQAAAWARALASSRPQTATSSTSRSRSKKLPTLRKALECARPMKP
jgi:hypothetical protein